MASARVAALFAAHARLVLGVCRSMLRDSTDAEDAAQQTFLSAYGSLLSGTAPDDEAAWLATIARNECRGRIRSRMREPLVLLDPDLTEASDDAHSIAIRRSEVAALRRALIDLPTQQRHAFVLREFGGLSYEELASSLSVSLASVESLLFRARRQLRARLQPAVSGAFSISFFLRDLLLRLATGGGESTGTAAKIASLPLAAKLAAAGTGVVLVTGSAVGLDGARTHHPAARAAAPRAAAAHARPHVRRAAPALRVRPPENSLTAFVAAPVKRVVHSHSVRTERHAVSPVVSSRSSSGGGSSYQAGASAQHRSGGAVTHRNKDDGSHGPSQPATPVEPTHPVAPVTPTAPTSPPPPQVPQTGGNDGSGDSSHDSGSGDSSFEGSGDSGSGSEPSGGGESGSHGGDSGAGGGDSGSGGGDSGSGGGDSGSGSGDSGSHGGDSGGAPASAPGD